MPIERVDRPGESQEAMDGKKILSSSIGNFTRIQYTLLSCTALPVREKAGLLHCLAADQHLECIRVKNLAMD
jgi:hypothetical protein